MIIDIVVLLLIIVFLIIGIMQGFIVSAFYLAAWVAGILCAWFFSGTFAAILSANVEGLAPVLNLCFGILLAFLLPFLIIRLAAYIANFFIKISTPLTMVNHLLGGVFGALKGAVIAVVALTVIHFLPAQGNLKQLKEDSTAYSIYKVIPFAKLWDNFKVEAEGAAQNL